MSDLGEFTGEFKRMNFFTGFFTTANDWNAGQQYHLDKRRLHNRGLHTAGIMPGIGDELAVEAADGLTVRVRPGAAVDGHGNEIYLHQETNLSLEEKAGWVYIAIRYDERPTDHIVDVDGDYSGDTRILERPVIEARDSAPDNDGWLELARIDLQAGATQIKPEEIDRAHVLRAGPAGLPPPLPALPSGDQSRIVVEMQGTRQAFLHLAAKFPVPSAVDARSAALMLHMLAEAGAVRPDTFPSLLAVLAGVEQMAGQEIGNLVPEIARRPEYVAYTEKVEELHKALQRHDTLDNLLLQQGLARVAAENLAGIALRRPEAVAGPSQRVVTEGAEAVVALDASASRAFEGRAIAGFHWDEKPIAGPA